MADEKTLTNIRRLIWLYFWLLLIEGSLRKWIVPQLSTPLLLVRDPVLLLAYYLAYRARIFPINGWITSLGIIAVLSLAVSIVPLWRSGAAFHTIALVDCYGFRCNFLHLPLIFIIARVFRPQDLNRMGWWTLVLVAPMAVLMVAQFNAEPDSLLNRTASGEGEMLTSAFGKVRPAGPFSFVFGVVAYFALATGFLLWAALKRHTYKLWLHVLAGSGLVIGTAVSGSRSVVGACAVVVASLGAVLFLRPSAVSRLGRVLVGVFVIGYILVQTPVFREGFLVLSTRFLIVSESREKSVSGTLIERVVGDFEQAIAVLDRAPFLGFGLGLGTNGGAIFMTGKMGFLLAESEWARVFLESGPLLGLSFVFWRCALTIYLGFLGLMSAKKFGNLLPILLFSSSALPLLNGQLGNPTILGFTVLVTGLALAARSGDEDCGPSALASEGKVAPKPRLQRRSAYAARLHGPGPASDYPNDSVDR